MKVKISDLDSERFVGLFREIKKGVWRLNDIGIKGCENEYMKDGDIVVRLDGVEWGDELVVRNGELVDVKSNSKDNSIKYDD